MKNKIDKEKIAELTKEEYGLNLNGNILKI
jgi:hypothetical protein